MRGKKKKKVTYAVVEISTASDQEIGHYYLGKKSFKELKKSAGRMLAIGIASIVIAIAGGALLLRYSYLKINDKDEEIKALNAQIQILTSEKNDIQSNLDEKIQAEQEKEAIDALLYVPSNYPVTGASTVTESEEVVALDATSTSIRPVLIFEGSEGASVVAAGSGTVLNVEQDAVYGFKIAVDHGNGYISLYYNGGNPTVQKGDAVTKETVLFEIGSYNRNVAFQIIENGTYIAPMSLIEIQG